MNSARTKGRTLEKRGERKKQEGEKQESERCFHRDDSKTLSTTAAASDRVKKKHRERHIVATKRERYTDRDS